MARVLEPFYDQLGERVSRLRAARGMSQHALGERMKPRMTRASIANIETGKQRVLAHTFVQLAAQLGCELDDLAGTRDDTPADETTLTDELQRKLEDVSPDLFAKLARDLGLPSRAAKR